MIELLIYTLPLVGLVLLIVSFSRSRNVYKALYSETNIEEIKKNYNELVSQLKTENNPKQRKALIKEIKKLLSYFNIDGSDFNVATYGNFLNHSIRPSQRKDLYKALLEQFDSSFKIGVSGFILVFISIVFYEIQTLVDPTPARIIGLILLFSMFLFVFLSMKFDHRAKLAKTFIVITVIAYIAMIYLMSCGAELIKL